MLNKDVLLSKYLRLGTLQAVADEYDVTRERVRQVIGDEPEYMDAVRRRSIDENAEIAKRLVADGLTTKEIMDVMGVSQTSVWKYCRYVGVVPSKNLVPIGCDMCIGVPYSRGLCRRCYENWLRRGKSKSELMDGHERARCLHEQAGG